MKQILITMFCGATLLSAQNFDFSSLDKLAARASGVNRVSMDGPQLRAALSLLPNTKNDEKIAQLKSIAAGITSLTVRNFEFGKEGQYNDSDLKPIRQQFANAKGWAKIVDSKENGEHSEIFILTEGEKAAGFAILAAEPSELSVVLLKGPVSLASLGGLGALASLPSMQVKPAPRTGGK